MDKLIFIIMLIMSLILFLLMYKIFNLTSKISRLQKRYNSLLRGRGDLNIEDLIREHSKDIDDSILRIDEINTLLADFEQYHKENLNSLNKKLDSQIHELRQKVFGKIENNYNLIQENLELNKQETNKNLNLISEQLSFAIQKVNLHRYDAFDNQTGELSFSIAMLDKYNNGVIITSINGRDNNYTYSKNIKNGVSEFDLSPEEELTLNNLIKK